MESIQANEDRYQLRTYPKLSISIEWGEGSYVYDQDGNRYLDFYAGHAVTSTGHCHPRVVAAIREQAGRLIFYSNVVYNSARGEAVKKLLQLAGEPYYQAFLANSGGEANENAIKLARAATQRAEIISVEGSFHGRNYGSLSATGIAKYREYLNTPVPMHRILPADEVAKAVTEQTAAVLIEPIQSMGGMREIPSNQLVNIEGACRSNGALLIFDEVQTGIARTGSFLYCTQTGTRPDMVTLAKGIASGFPAAAVLLLEELARTVNLGDLGTTFGGGPLACAAISATMDVIADEKLVERAAAMGKYLKTGLSSLNGIEEVRGRGLLIGIKLAQGKTARELHQKLLEKRILTGTSMDPQVLRLMPPLTMTREEADIFLGAAADS